VRGAWYLAPAAIVVAAILVVALGPETSPSSCDVWRADLQLASSSLELSRGALAEAREAAHEELTPLVDTASHSRLAVAERYGRRKQDEARLVVAAERRFGVPRFEARRRALVDRYRQLLERRPRSCELPRRD
jgi:hypothetical protein